MACRARKTYRWHVIWKPPYAKKALWQLAILAKSAQMRGDREESLYIWETIRRAVLASRHVTQPHQEYLYEAERAIYAYRAEASFVGDKSEISTRPEDPSALFSLLLFLGLILWIGGAVFVFLPLARKPVASRLAPVTISMGGLLLWLVGCY